MSLERRRAFVTGGGRGIGRQVALDLAKAGAAVAVCSRTTGEVERVAAEIRDAGGTAHAFAVDVSRAAAVQSGFTAAVAALGGIDILVNGAGIAPSALVHRTTDETWDSTIATNLSGAFYGIRAALPGMLERNWGRVITIASIASKTGYPYIAAYAASKHGVLGLTRCAALEVAKTGITVNAVCPGYVDTPMTDQGVERMAAKTGRPAAEIRKTLEDMSPQKRLYTSEEVSALVLFLCGDAAAGINGQGLSIDGGTVL